LDLLIVRLLTQEKERRPKNAKQALEILTNAWIDD
jgi:hypothetical protein